MGCCNSHPGQGNELLSISPEMISLTQKEANKINEVKAVVIENPKKEYEKKMYTSDEMNDKNILKINGVINDEKKKDDPESGENNKNTKQTEENIESHPNINSSSIKIISKDNTKEKNNPNKLKLDSSINERRAKPRRSQLLENLKFGPEIFVQIKTENIFEEYSPGQILGEGAFGQVRLVTHKTTGIVRAMKLLKKSALINEEEKKLFSELYILKNLDHPHIVKLFELFQDSDNYYLITEFCSGGELFERIKNYQYMTEKLAANIMKQILLAVVYCHSQNIVHRDLKPENILFESTKPDANLKVIDFGTSRKFEANKKMKKTLGTPYYVAPEVLKQDYNEKCDVWSVGVILYILLCGYPPFMGNSQEEVLQNVKIGKYEFKGKDWANISSEAKYLIRDMLRYDVRKRISAEEALNNKWINKNTSTALISSNAIKQLINFHTENKIQSAIFTFIMMQLTPANEKEELKKFFIQMDANGDGKLSAEELIEAYSKVYKNKDEARYLVNKLMKDADSNSSGKIDYTEFLVAASKREKLLAKTKVEQAFKLFDADGNGFITYNELKKIMGSDLINEEVWKEILLQCDVNNDEKISLNEFFEFLSNFKEKLE